MGRYFIEYVLVVVMSLGAVMGVIDGLSTHSCRSIDFTKRWHYAVFTAPIACNATVWLLSDVGSDYE